ncbi:hypothetical protein V6N13_140205 [Hibiscus sabdariffa]|uniref:Uncharacterized protein n=1 Tax=Hibiscus sabdariffa TaxID=183260 RepID=A0ABR2QAU8_9ROSI
MTSGETSTWPETPEGSREETTGKIWKGEERFVPIPEFPGVVEPCGLIFLFFPLFSRLCFSDQISCLSGNSVVAAFL